MGRLQFYFVLIVSQSTWKIEARGTAAFAKLFSRRYCQEMVSNIARLSVTFSRLKSRM